ncbi:MarR family winged helix-turn-helix transcriptional regulator [Nocardiopsis dassonvillei]|uniref:MarR family winged helix-turn-helix transcriptional regulator n=1 Tax=Nocardiopsis dassonvillei TaxID=2014 RepID=UPI000B9D6B9A|nr:MarR family transcriptional regulator [Nocardiopsis dassonvillei]ASU58646.1 MarR family transcriptional regulator [Nocardiopsis dassonvillei]
MEQGAGRQEADDTRVPDRAAVEGALRFVPLIETYYRRAHAEMPAELRRLFTDHHLTARHGAVLSQLVHGQELGMGELSSRLGVGPSTVSELVGDLSRVGLVVRREDPANRRRALVSLADEHRELMHAFVASRARTLLRAFDRLSPEQREGFAAGLEAWARELHGI